MDITNVTLDRNSLYSALNDDNVTTNMLNGTEFLEDFDFFVPNWYLHCYFAFICAGGLLNFFHIVSLARGRRNGTLSIIFQISLVDILMLHVAITEVLSLRHRTWMFSQNHCPLYKGTEILTNSLIVYLIICINFHIISLWNSRKWDVQKTRKNPLTACDDEDSNECHVTRSENANRIVNIDYSKRKHNLSVILPTILIWFLCVSLSIPNFTLSSTLKLHDNTILCAIIDNYHWQVLQYLLVVFRIIIPIPLLIITLIVLVVKLSQTQEDIDNVLTKKFREIRVLLIFSILLTVLYILTSLQRQILYLMHVLSYQTNDKVTNFQFPPLYNNWWNSIGNTNMTMLHYSSSTFRAILCFYMLPKFRELVENRSCFCQRV